MASGGKRYRYQQAEMRLIAECPKKQTRERWSAVDEKRGRPKQSRGQKRVLSQAERPQHRREGEKAHEDCPVAVAHDAARDKQIQEQASCLEDQERRNIRQMGEDGTKQQKWRWVKKEVIIYPYGRGALFGRVVFGSI